MNKRSTKTGAKRKRNLPPDTSSDDHVTERRQSPDTTGLAPAETCKGEAVQRSLGDGAEFSTESRDNMSVQDADADSWTSSSSSGTDETSSSDEASGDGEHETGLTQKRKNTPNDEDDASEARGSVEDLPKRKKPRISALAPPPDLCARLSSFLPTLRKANAELQDPSEVLARRLDDVADDVEHYIEMSLGLGVLTEKKSATTRADDVKFTRRHSTSSGEDSGLDMEDAEAAKNEQRGDRTPLTKLMGGGKHTSDGRPGIQELPA